MSIDLTGAHACPGCQQCLTTDEYCRFCEERLTLRKENELLKAELAKRPKDDPEMDGTEYAHPGWWRGQDYTFQMLCAHINEILDGKPVDGVCQEPYQALRLRLADFVRRALFGDQCYQDQCENAYIEATVGKQLRAELTQANAAVDKLYTDSMIAHRWFTDTFGDGFSGRDFEVKCPMADREITARKEHFALAQAHLYNLREAAKAVCERWDSITWKDGQHTGVLIHQLRMAMETPEKL